MGLPEKKREINELVKELKGIAKEFKRLNRRVENYSGEAPYGFSSIPEEGLWVDVEGTEYDDNGPRIAEDTLEYFVSDDDRDEQKRFAKVVGMMAKLVELGESYMALAGEIQRLGKQYDRQFMKEYEDYI